MQEFIRQLKFRGRAVLLAIMFAAIAGHADDPSLSQPVYRSGQFYFDVHGESKAGYVVLSTTNLSDWTPLPTNQAVSSVRTLVSPAQNSLAFFKVQRLPLPLFRFALVVKDTIDLNGNNFLSDSFDSSDPSSSANGLYSPNKRADHGDIAVNSSLTNSLTLGNVNVFGALFTGPNGHVSFGPNSVVGELAWHVGLGTGIEPGFWRNDLNVSFPDVQRPFSGGAFTPNGTGGFITNTTTTLTFSSNWSGGTTIAYPWGASSVTTNYPISSTTSPAGSPGPVTTTATPNTTPTTSSTYPLAGTYVGTVVTRVVNSGPQIGRGTWYDYNMITSTTTTYTYPTFTATYSSYNTNSTTTVTYYDYILDSGNYQATDLNGGSPGQPASIYVRGNAILYVTASANLGGNAAGNPGIAIKPGKSLRFYSSAPTVTLCGNDTGLASSFSYFGLPGNTALQIGGNGNFFGTVYAPNAELTLNGIAASTTIDYMGASITKSLRINGHLNFPYDQC